MKLQEIYKALREEYNGTLFSDNFLKTHIDMTQDQIVCWFDNDSEDESEFDEKCDSAILFYDEVVRFLVDSFGEEFKYDDPRISSDYIDRNNMRGEFEITVDEDGCDEENGLPVVAIWKNEETEMKPRFDENKFGRLVKETWERYPSANGCTIHDCGDCFVVTNKNGTTIGQCDTMTEAETIAEMCNDEMKNKPFLVSEGNELTEDAILDAIPVDARDGLIDINEPDGSFGRYTWYVRFAPFSDEEAKEAADGIKQVTGRRTQVAGFGREIYVLVMDYPSRPMSESKKLVKEGAGAGYTVTIKDVKLGDVTVKKIGDGDWEFEAVIVPASYKIEASDYYNMFCPMDSEFGGEEWVEVAGKVRGVCWWYDDEYDVERQIRGTTQDIGFSYGHGWIHVNLPENGHIESDHIETDGHDTWEIQSIELDAPQLSDCVNYCHEHFREEEEEEDETEEVDESYDYEKDDGRKKVMDALEEFRQVLWDDVRNGPKEDHDLRSACFKDTDEKISYAVQKYFKYSRI